MGAELLILQRSMSDFLRRFFDACLITYGTSHCIIERNSSQLDYRDLQKQEEGGTACMLRGVVEIGRIPNREALPSSSA